MEKDWAKIRTYNNAIEAEMGKQLLEENGIPAILLNKQDSSLKFGKIELYVSSGDVGQAFELFVFVDKGEEE